MNFDIICYADGARTENLGDGLSRNGGRHNLPPFPVEIGLTDLICREGTRTENLGG